MPRSAPPPTTGSCVLHIHCGGFDPAAYARVLELLGEFTTAVQSVPPDTALADVRDAVRFYDRLPEQLAMMMRTRAAALCDARLTIGIGPNPLLATMAAFDGPPDRIRVVDDQPAAVEAFLRGKPVAALPDVDQRLVDALEHGGVHTVGQLARVPLAVLEGIVGRSAAGTLFERARGVDPRPVVPQVLPRSLSAERLLGAEGGDDAAVHREVLGLAAHLGARLRAARRLAGVLSLTVRLLDHSSITRTRALAEPTWDTEALSQAAIRVLAGLVPPGIRVRLVALRAEGLSRWLPDPSAPRTTRHRRAAPGDGAGGRERGVSARPHPHPDFPARPHPETLGGADAHAEAVPQEQGRLFDPGAVFPAPLLRADEPHPIRA